MKKSILGKLSITLTASILITACADKPKENNVNQAPTQLTSVEAIKNWCADNDSMMYRDEAIDCICIDKNEIPSISNAGEISCIEKTELDKYETGLEFKLQNYTTGELLAVSQRPNRTGFDRSFAMLISSSSSETEYKLMREFLDTPWIYQAKYNAYSATLDNFEEGPFLGKIESVIWDNEKAEFKGDCLDTCVIKIPNKTEDAVREIHFVSGVKSIDQVIEADKDRFQIYSPRAYHSIFLQEKKNLEDDKETKEISFSLERDDLVYHKFITDINNDVIDMKGGTFLLNIMNEKIKSDNKSRN